MHCINCGSELNESAKFCTNCGTKVEVPVTEPAEELAQQGTAFGYQEEAPVQQEPAFGYQEEEPVQQEPAFGYQEEVPVQQEPAFDYQVEEPVGSPTYAGPVYPHQGVNPTPAYSEKSGLSITSMIIGIVALMIVCIPFAGPLVGIVGLMFGVIGRKKGARGMALTGIITSSIAIGLGVLYIVVPIIIAFFVTM